MRRGTCIVVGCGILISLVAFGDQSTARKPPIGTWYRNKDNTVTRFEIKSDAVHYVSEGPLGKTEADADCGISGDGKVLFGRIRTVKEGTGVATGDLLSFGFRVKGETLTISDWKGTGGAGFGFVLQGDYKRSADK